MIYLTGDTHGKPARLSSQAMPFSKKWGKNDMLIVCGDFGYLANGAAKEDLLLRELALRPYTICFLDGNRDNIDLLNTYPVTQWHGGMVHRIRHNIIHLMRGQVYEVDQHKIFTMGGGYSIDRYRLHEGVDWWANEMPSSAEYETARQNLQAAGMEVDYILTHTSPTSASQEIFAANAQEQELSDFLQCVKDEVTYQKWYFGHVHMDAALADETYALFTATRELTSAALL
ncbi:MAG: hypothetical protein GX096_07645 [Clostridiales bacterium]|nr:hypothetical protein [Clostridiales bacterium]